MSSFWGLFSMIFMSLIGLGFCSSFFTSSFAFFRSSISSSISSLLLIGSIEIFGFDVVGRWFLVVGSFSVSSLWTSSEICFAASAFTEIESMPCLTRNSTISGFEPACPQMLVSTSCFLHSRITLEICFRTAQFISL